MPIPKLTNAILSAAILGFEEQKRSIDAQIDELRTMLSGGPASTAATPEAIRGSVRFPPSFVAGWRSGKRRDGPM
jgi:hypothetical protein